MFLTEILFVSILCLCVWYKYERYKMWKRPDHVPGGHVWMRFKGRERPGLPTQRYQIRDLEEPFKEKCLALMETTFLNDEPLCQILDVKSDPISVAEIRSNWEEMLRQRICLCCFLEEDGVPTELVGFNILTVKTDEDPDVEPDVRGKPWKKLLQTLLDAEALVNVFSYYSVSKYITSSGLTIVPEHRGQNIGARMIEARKNLCKAFSIEAVATVFTAKTSQVLAAKCNYEILATLNYSTMALKGVDLSGCTTPCALYMGIKYQFDNQTIQ